MPDNQKTYTLSLKSVADMLGKSERTIYRYVKNGNLSAKLVNEGNRQLLKFNIDDVNKFRQTPTSDVNEKTGDLSDRLSTQNPNVFQQLYKELQEKYEKVVYALGALETKQQQVKMLEERAASLTIQNQKLTEEKLQIEEEKKKIESEAEHRWKELSKTKKELKTVNWTYVIITIIIAIFLIGSRLNVLELAREWSTTLLGVGARIKK